MEKIIRLSVVFLFFSFVSKTLSVYEFGVFTLAQTIATLLTGVTIFGMDNVLLKEFSISNNTNEILSSALLFRLSASVIIIFLFGIALLFILYPLEYKMVFLIAGMCIFFQLQTAYYSYFQAHSKSHIVTKTSLAALVVSSLVKVVFIYKKLGLIYYTFSFLLDYVFSFLFIYIYARKEKLIFRFKFFKIDLLKNLVKQSLPIFISTLIVMIYTRIDQLMITKMLGVEDVAIFNVAVRISDAYMFIPIAIASSFFPMVSKKNDAYTIKQYFYITHLFTVISALIVIVLTPLVIYYFFGPRYTGSIQVSYMIIVANVISSLGMVSTNILILRNASYLRIYRAIGGLVINVILNIILIPKLGINGAAISSLLSQIVAAWLSNYFSHKSRDCFYIQSMSILTFGIPCIKEIISSYKTNKFKD